MLMLACICAVQRVITYVKSAIKNTDFHHILYTAVMHFGTEMNTSDVEIKGLFMVRLEYNVLDTAQYRDYIVTSR